MALILRQYQEKLISQTRESLRTYDSVLIVSPTGTGKTALSATMLGSAAQKQKRSFFIVHRQELVEQSSLAFQKADIPHGFVCAGQPINPFVPIHICSIDTLKNRLDRLRAPHFIVWDESHHSPAAGWTTVKEYYPKAKHVGLTATPCRLDGKGLINNFQHMIKSPPVKWFIEKGYLCTYKIFAPNPPDLKGIHSRYGDYIKGELEGLMDNSVIVGNAITHYRELAHNKKAVVFCVSVKHSQHVAAQFTQAGYKAAHIDGSMDKGERRTIIEQFRQGIIQILCNVDLIGEGFDLPDIEVVILLRPTQSLSLFLQQVGRVLRPVPGKEYALILDHAGNVYRHGLPDEERNWTLEGQERIRRKLDDEESRTIVKSCPKCFYVHSPRPSCPSCGHIYIIVGEIPKELTGKLVEIDPVTFIRQSSGIKSSSEILDSLIAIGRKKNMQDPIRWAIQLYTGSKKR